VAAGSRAVVLSGWSRTRDGRGEAELMRAGWAGPNVPLICDPTARSTAENATAVARATHALAADEVVVVTSWWHSLRAGRLVQAALPDSSIAVHTSSPRGVPSPAVLVRELVCLAGLPVQTRRLRRASRRWIDPGPEARPGDSGVAAPGVALRNP
jgi:hypothetical protein